MLYIIYMYSTQTYRVVRDVLASVDRRSYEWAQMGMINIHANRDGENII